MEQKNPKPSRLQLFAEFHRHDLALFFSRTTTNNDRPRRKIAKGKQYTINKQTSKSTTRLQLTATFLPPKGLPYPCGPKHKRISPVMICTDPTKSSSSSSSLSRPPLPPPQYDLLLSTRRFKSSFGSSSWWRGAAAVPLSCWHFRSVVRR
jgi:hypothetical protein